MSFTNYTEYRKAEDIKRMKFIVSAIQEIKTENIRIIEIGCGNGNNCYQLAKMGYDVTGIDISEETIANAKKKHQLPNLKFECRSAENVDTTQKFDAIVCSEVIEHLYDPDIVVSHLQNILKDGGKAVINVPNGFGPREVLMTKPMQNAMKNNDWRWKSISFFKRMLGYKGTTVQSSAPELSHIQFFSKKAVITLAEKFGFRIEKFGVSNFVEGVFPFSLFTKLIPPLQRFDCWLADRLPQSWASGFMTVWVKK
jgi:2-polyprenyl-3-methyl-5-hydroxy-6-metoxy-1,4-benzoquinol methylase